MALVSELYFFGIRWYIWVHKALYEQGKNYSIVLYSILGTAHTHGFDQSVKRWLMIYDSRKFSKMREDTQKIFYMKDESASFHLVYRCWYIYGM